MPSKSLCKVFEVTQYCLRSDRPPMTKSLDAQISKKLLYFFGFLGHDKFIYR